MTEEQFLNFLQQLGIDDISGKMEQYRQYLDILDQKSRVMNLTTITAPDEVYAKHFRDSLSLYERLAEESELLDIGSGAGFPGIPVKIALPQLKVTMVEATGRKCTFLQEVIDRLDLSDIQVLNARAEELRKQGIHCKNVTARAVANLPVLCELCLPLTDMGGQFIAMKGPSGVQEAKEAAHAIRILGGRQEAIDEYTLPDGSQRVNIVIRKMKETPSQYPRAYAQIKKKPL